MQLYEKLALIWVFILVVGILTIAIRGGHTEYTTCINGSVVDDPSLCPQCINDTHCGVDRVCKFGSCRAAPCVTTSDCESLSSSCIYGVCIDTGADEVI